SMQASTVGGNFGMFVNGSFSVAGGAAVSSGGSFAVTAAGNLTVFGGSSITTSVQGNLSLIQSAGTTMTVDGNLLANNGSIVLQNMKAAGSIILGDGTTAVAIATDVTGTKSLNANGLVSIFLGGTLPQLNGHTSGSVNGITITQTGTGTAFFGNFPNQIQA